MLGKASFPSLIWSTSTCCFLGKPSSCTIKSLCSSRARQKISTWNSPALSSATALYRTLYHNITLHEGPTNLKRKKITYLKRIWERTRITPLNCGQTFVQQERRSRASTEERPEKNEYAKWSRDKVVNSGCPWKAQTSHHHSLGSASEPVALSYEVQCWKFRSGSGLNCNVLKL